jgi:hypothetical protein
MSRVMAQGDFRPMAANREANSKGAMADLVAILEARRADYARAEAEVDTAGAGVGQSFAELLRIVAQLTGHEAATPAPRSPGEGWVSGIRRLLGPVE